MDAFRVLLLSLMLGQSVSANGNFTEKDFIPAPLPSVAQASPSPTSPVIWDASAQIPSALVLPDETAAPAASPVPTQRPSGLPRNLRLGMKGDDVTRVQQRLSDLGYDVAVGGTFSGLTEEAVLFFQYVNKLDADGIVGPKTYKKLTSRTALGPSGTTVRTLLSYGMKGQDVMELQMRLGQLGYYDDIVSGNYLKNTRKAVYAFQEAHGLYADGVAGPDTLYLVFSQMAKQAPGPGDRTASADSNPGQQHGSGGSNQGQQSGSDNSNPGQQHGSGGSNPGQQSGSSSSNPGQQHGSGGSNQGQQSGSGGSNPGQQSGSGSSNPGQQQPNPGPNSGQTAASPPLYMRTLSKGISGVDVSQLTARLRELGFYPYTPTSYFDENVYWAVYTFQQFNKLAPDGIAGEETLTRVYAGDAVHFSTGQQEGARETIVQASVAQNPRQETLQSPVENPGAAQESINYGENEPVSPGSGSYNPWEDSNSDAEFIWPDS